MCFSVQEHIKCRQSTPGDPIILKCDQEMKDGLEKPVTLRDRKKQKTQVVWSGQQTNRYIGECEVGKGR